MTRRRKYIQTAALLAVALLGAPVLTTALGLSVPGAILVGFAIGYPCGMGIVLTWLD